jgi:small subunit ribosomal protein S16
MTTRIRLRRMGSNKRPFFRVVVADQRSPRDGRFIENIGMYHPLDDPSVIQIDQDRALHWLRVGAQPSNQVRNLMQKTGIWDEFVKERPAAAVAVKERPEKPRVSKKAKQRAEAAASEPEAAPAPEAAPEPEVAREPEAGSELAPEAADANAAEAVEAVAEPPAEPPPDESAADADPSEDA